MLTGEVPLRVRDLVREICGEHDIKIMKGHVSKDHVHLLVSIPPQVTISRMMQWLNLNPAVRPRRSRQTAMFSLPRDVPRLHPLGEVRSSCDAQ